MEAGTAAASAPRLGWTGYFELTADPGTYPALDGLRAVAILLVMARHAIGALPGAAATAADSLPLQWLSNLACNGWLGVDLFFVLSGCLIGLHLLRLKHSPLAHYRFKPYILKRICRTFPLYYAIIALLCLGLIPHYAPTVDAPRLLVLMLFLQDYLGTDVLVSLWSLAVEEKFYVLAPFLILGIRKALPLSRVLALLLALSLLAPALRALLMVLEPPVSYSDFFWRMRAPYSWEPFLFGLMCAFLVSNNRARQFVGRYARALMLVSSAVLACLFCSTPLVESQHWNASSLAIYAAAASFACLVYTSIVSANGASGVLGGLPLRAISKLSYALYLTHYTVIPAALAGAHRMTGTASGPAFAACFLVLYIGASFGFSLLLHFLLEKPFLLLKERIR